ncbi:hypothetical protein [Mycobacterium sp. AT1]|uniref:hypothetical protein n=1 Tax=Mycobacterium sp. AT1 TaxID=1961706 RepID=UPI0009AC4116|nr:hypothetical protein [Mycobacterium sp. AT1]OPX05531.1 hypothetical protein B1790_31600 [Mycobacterium sp. AT1]
MYVQPEFRDSVCFIYARIKEQEKPVGTAFFVSMPIGTTGHETVMLVTALHVISNIQLKSDDQQVRLRVNTKDGGFRFVEINAAHWHRPDQVDEILDIAFFPWLHVMDSEFDVRSIPIGFAATRDVMDADQLGVGNEVAFAGLFVNHHGKLRNEPIVRFGNIAAMPAEPVAFRSTEIEAYLVESRSVGGLSGSPVWVDSGIWRNVDGVLLRREGGSTAGYLLGIMNGHWDARIDATAMDDAPPVEFVNMGIAVVTPVDKLIGLIMSVLGKYLDDAAKQLDGIDGSAAVAFGYPLP